MNKQPAGNSYGVEMKKLIVIQDGGLTSVKQ